MPLIQSVDLSERDPKEIQIPEIQTKIREFIPQISLDDEERLKQTLEEKGAGLERTIAVVSDILNYGTAEQAVQLRAAELALKLHRVLKEGGNGNNCNFTFVIKGGDAVVNSILQPQR